MSCDITIAFNTANLVARCSGYRFKLSHWMDEHRKTVSKTHEKEFAAICREIALAGYSSVELWVAHIDPAGMTDVRAANYRAILADFGLTPIALAGTLSDSHAGVCRKLNIPACCGGYWGSDHATVTRLVRETGLLFNYENHSETSVDQVRELVRFGADGLAVAVDTGWFSTQHVVAADAIRGLGRLVRHVHLKDVEALGGHETVALGTGATDIPACIRALKDINYTGVLSWEDEPEDRNPMEIAVEMRLYIQSLWSKP